MSKISESTKLKKLIGGINVNIEEKNENLKLINDAILQNNQGLDIITVDYTTFAKGYPDSFELINPYYDSLYQVQLNKLKTSNKKNDIMINQKIKYDIISQKKNTLMIFIPLILEQNISHDELDINIIELASLINNYKKIITNVKKIKDLGKNDEKYHIAKILCKEIIINGLDLDEIANKYDITEFLIEKYIEYLKDIDEFSYNEVKLIIKQKQDKKKNFLKNLTLKIGGYCKEKIRLETSNGLVEIPFTILDYYTITDCSLKSIVPFVNDHRNFNSNNRDENFKKNLVKEMFQNQVNVGPYMTKEQILNSNISVGKNGKITKLNEEICDKIFNIFEQENIPKGKLLIEIAFHRYACNYPILPLKLIEDKKINQEEKVVKPLVKTLKKEINDK